VEQLVNQIECCFLQGVSPYSRMCVDKSENPKANNEGVKRSEQIQIPEFSNHRENSEFTGITAV